MKKLLFVLFLLPALLHAQPGGVTRIRAGDGVTISPTGGTGVVTINSTGSGSGNVTNNATLTSGNIVIGGGTTVVGITNISVTGGNNVGNVGTINVTTVNATTLAGATANGQLWIGNVTSGNFEKAVPAGTANQITVTASEAGLTLSTPSTFITPGSIAATTTLAGTTLDTGQGANELYAMDQAVRTSDSPTFAAVSTTGSISTGVGGSTAGVLELGQGTAPSDGTTSVKIYAATGVTSYKRLLPASVGSTGYVLETVSGTTQTESLVPESTLATNVRATIIEKIAVFSVDGGGSAIATGTVAGTARIPFACTLTGYSITATAASGTNTIKIWLKATATTIPESGDSINTSGVSLTTGTAVASATLTDFTDTTYAAGDMARCSVTAVDGTATDLTVTLYGTRL